MGLKVEKVDKVTGEITEMPPIGAPVHNNEDASFFGGGKSAGEKPSGELAALIKQVHKDKGEKVLIMGCEVPVVKRIPTGMFEPDLALGGGFPRGRYSIIYGPEGGGKTGHAFAAIAQAQLMPPPCNRAVLVDLEGTFDAEWAAMYGVKVDELIVIKPGYGEEAVDLIIAAVEPAEVAILVVDSLAMIVATKEIEQSAENFDVGTSSILIKRMCNKLVLALNKEEKRGHTPAVILINQVRHKIGTMGDPETMPGGNTMKFLSSLTIRVSSKPKIVKDVHPHLAAFRECYLSVKKAKVPITKLVVEYDMVVYPHDGLRPGQTNSWNAVKNDLQSLDILKKHPKGWEYGGVVYPTQVPLADKYAQDPLFRAQMQKHIVNSSKGKMFFKEAEGHAAGGK